MDEFIIPPPVSNHTRTNRVLGEGWLENEVNKAEEAIKGKVILHPSRMSPTYAWINHLLVSEVKQSKSSNQRALLLDSLEIDLRDLAGVTLPSSLRQRLRNDHDFSKTGYELRIAAGFRRLGHLVIWCPPIKQKHPEFLVLVDDSDILSVECKKRDTRDGYEEEGSRFWRHLQFHLVKKMDEESLNYWIKVSGREFYLADIETLVSEIVSVIKANKYGQFDSGTRRYHVEYTHLAEPGESIDIELVNMFPRGDFGVNKGRRYRSMVGPVKDPKLIRMEITDDPEHRIKGILRNLKMASKQIIQGLANIVYIDISIPEYEREQAEFSNIANAIRGELATKHRHISAVILTNIYPALTRDEYLGWRIRTELIVQSKPNVCLPKGFRFPGDVAGTHWMPGDQASYI